VLGGGAEEAWEVEHSDIENCHFLNAPAGYTRVSAVRDRGPRTRVLTWVPPKYQKGQAAEGK
jgi:hypothetical protein